MGVLTTSHVGFLARTNTVTPPSRHTAPFAVVCLGPCFLRFGDMRFDDFKTRLKVKTTQPRSRWPDPVVTSKEAGSRSGRRGSRRRSGAFVFASRFEATSPESPGSCRRFGGWKLGAGRQERPSCNAARLPAWAGFGIRPACDHH
jgi:hypothetical protein